MLKRGFVNNGQAVDTGPFEHHAPTGCPAREKMLQLHTGVETLCVAASRDGRAMEARQHPDENTQDINMACMAVWCWTLFADQFACVRVKLIPDAWYQAVTIDVTSHCALFRFMAAARMPVRRNATLLRLVGSFMVCTVMTNLDQQRVA